MMSVKCLAAAVVVALSAPVANAAAIDFDVAGSGGGSSVSLSHIAGGCAFVSSCASASLAAGLDANVFSLAQGESRSFDFLTFTATPSWGGAEVFGISATLAFDLPGGQSTTGTGFGKALNVFGTITGGYLNFTAGVPELVTLANGNSYLVDFEDGLAVFGGQSVTHLGDR